MSLYNLNQCNSGCGHSTVWFGACDTYPFFIYIQLDVPYGSLQYQYGPDDPLQELGGYASVSITSKSMRVTFYNASGNACIQCVCLPIYSIFSSSAMKLYSVKIKPIERRKHQTK